MQQQLLIGWQSGRFIIFLSMLSRAGGALWGLEQHSRESGISRRSWQWAPVLLADMFYLVCLVLRKMF